MSCPTNECRKGAKCAGCMQTDALTSTPPENLSIARLEELVVAARRDGKPLRWSVRAELRRRRLFWDLRHGRLVHVSGAVMK